MVQISRARQLTGPLCRCILWSAILMTTAGATWINPPTANQSGVNVAPQTGVATPSPSGTEGAPDAGITVDQWQFSPTVPGQPVYLSMTLAGSQAAIDRMRAGGSLTIQVHWERENAATAPGAPNLVTDLTIGRPGLADALEREVSRKGFFEWHSWARKDMLGAGTWTVSLTYPDGQPLACGADAQPCRFTINIG
jgi:hypothetical protein